jgi:glycosyltransferase involved in cell wall biosynthesis
MKVAIISTVIGTPWAGSEEFWFQTALKLMADGHSVSCSLFQVDKYCWQHQKYKDSGGLLYYRPIIKNGRIHVWTHKFISKFNFLFKEEPNVLLLSLGSLMDVVLYPDLARYLIKNKNIKLVILCLYNSDNIIYNKEGRSLIKAFTDRASDIVFVSHHNKRLAERQLAKRLYNAHVITSPISYLDKFESLEISNKSIFSMASVARLDVMTKGQDILLETLSSEKWKNREWTLDIYGKGADLEYITELISMYNLNHRIRICGIVDDTREIWKKNNILVMPSRSEGLSLALLEAMICGRVCIVTDVGGVSEVIKDSVSGYIAEAPSAKYFDSALERAWSNKDKHDQVRFEANKVANTLFKIQPVEKLIQIIKQ